MNSRQLIAYLLRWFFTLALPFLLVAASVRLLLTREFLRLEYLRAEFPADPYGFSAQDRLEYGLYAIDYLYQAGDSSTLAALQLPREKCWRPVEDDANCPLFNANELRHLEDVKRIVTFIFAVAVFCGVALAAALIVALARPELQPPLQRGVRSGAILTLAAILMLAVVAAAAWDSAFDRFHELFFATGSWRFPFTDSLIRLYPEQLFVDASLVIGGLCATAAVAVLLLESLWQRRGF